MNHRHATGWGRRWLVDKCSDMSIGFGTFLHLTDPPTNQQTNIGFYREFTRDKITAIISYEVPNVGVGSYILQNNS